MTKVHEVPQEKLDELRATHGEKRVLLLTTNTDDGALEVAVVKPAKIEYDRFRKQFSDPDKRDVAVENLVRSAVKCPAKAEFDALLADYPAIADELGKPLLQALGMSNSAEVGKR